MALYSSFTINVKEIFLCNFCCSIFSMLNNISVYKKDFAMTYYSAFQIQLFSRIFFIF